MVRIYCGDTEDKRCWLWRSHHLSCVVLGDNKHSLEVENEYRLSFFLPQLCESLSNTAVYSHPFVFSPRCMLCFCLRFISFFSDLDVLRTFMCMYWDLYYAINIGHSSVLGFCLFFWSIHVCIFLFMLWGPESKRPKVFTLSWSNR